MKNYEPNTTRYAICTVGAGFSIEDRRTGERVGWFASERAAMRRWRKLVSV